MYSFDKQKIEEKFKKSYDAFLSQLSSIRSGRANAGFLEGVTVEIYGSKMKLKEVASISVLDNHTLSVSPFDRSAAGSIAKSIQEAQLGVNPIQDGGIVRVPLPQMTEDRRKELSKLAEKYGEEGKIAMRNVRRDENDLIKKAQKNKEISEDEMRRNEADVQKTLDNFIKKLESDIKQKQFEIMKV